MEFHTEKVDNFNTLTSRSSNEFFLAADTKNSRVLYAMAGSGSDNSFERYFKDETILFTGSINIRSARWQLWRSFLTADTETSVQLNGRLRRLPSR